MISGRETRTPHAQTAWPIIKEEVGGVGEISSGSFYFLWSAERFRIICAVHDGLFGERNLNQQMAELLGRRLYDDGVPVIILQNDPQLGLNNGDIGICWGGKVCFSQWRNNASGLPIFVCVRAYGRQQIPAHTAASAQGNMGDEGAALDEML